MYITTTRTNKGTQKKGNLARILSYGKVKKKSIFNIILVETMK